METETRTREVEVIHIDAKHRRIQMKSVLKEEDIIEKYDRQLGLSRINEDQSSFTIRQKGSKADVFQGQLLPVPYGFILYHNGETYIVNGSAYIEAMDNLPNGDLGGESLSTTLPLDYVVEGTGPVEGKMVVQWTAEYGTRLMAEDVDKCFYAHGNRIDDITLASSYQHMLSEFYATMSYYNAERASYWSASFMNICELIKDLGDAYQIRKYSVD